MVNNVCLFKLGLLLHRAIYVWCRRTDELVDGPNASRITPSVSTSLYQTPTSHSMIPMLCNLSLRRSSLELVWEVPNQLFCLRPSSRFLGTG